MRLGDLIEKHAPVVASQGRISTLGAALELMPPPLLHGRAWLVYWRAVSVLGLAGAPAQALAEGAFHAFRTAGDASGTLMSWSLLVHAIVTCGDDLHPLDGWLTLLDEMALDAPTPAIAAQVELSKLVAHFFGTRRAPWKWRSTRSQAVNRSDAATAVRARAQLVRTTRSGLQERAVLRRREALPLGAAVELRFGIADVFRIVPPTRVLERAEANLQSALDADDSTGNRADRLPSDPEPSYDVRPGPP